jgi:hypothetical protein
MAPSGPGAALRRIVPMEPQDSPMTDISKQTDAELAATIEQSKDADLRGAARAELESRTLRRWRIVADRQARIAWLAMISACASALAAIAAAVLAWMHR